MNEHKFCFIACYNDDLFFSECSAYIRALQIPDGFSAEILGVEGAASIAAGYQYAMTHSDAKYKIYLHQDVFIINPNFLSDLLNLFDSDASIGMVGLVGSIKMPDSMMMWDADRVGCCRQNFIVKESVDSYRPGNRPYVEVEAIDGLLMATCHDIPWRDDLFTGWDFYDISQSQEFRLAGYKIAVPCPDAPWAIHDEALNDLANYEHWKQVYIKEYQKRQSG